MLKKFVQVFSVVILLGIPVCITRTFAQELIAGNAKEKKILSLVAALPEVQERAKQIRIRSAGKTQITLMVSAPPDYSIPYYQVNVNDNAPAYDNYYQFAVDPKTYQIFFYDAATNKQYTVAEWRKRKKKR